MRGFSRNSIGPRALYANPFTGGYYESGNTIGGNAFWTASAEFIVPTPLLAEAYKNSVRTSIFFDAGALWDSRSKMYAVDYSKASKYRTSVGLSVVWMSPLGPLSFNLAKAIKKYDKDDTQVFNFNMGSTF
jgi:outer membrane protein insertion porin family